MIRYIKYLLMLVLAAGLLTIGLANSQLVTLSLLTPELADLTRFSWQVTVPLYFVAFGGIAVGLLIGFVWEWLREARHRAEVARRQRQVRELAREVQTLKGERDKGKDEVLVLLDQSGPRRSA